MKQNIGIMVGLIFLPVNAWADEQEAEAPGFPPNVGVAKAVIKDGRTEVRVTAPVVMEETIHSWKVGADGKKVPHNKRRKIMGMVSEWFLLDAKNAVTSSKDGKIESILLMNQIKVFHKGGKAVRPEEVLTLLRCFAPVESGISRRLG